MGHDNRRAQKGLRKFLLEPCPFFHVACKNIFPRDHRPGVVLDDIFIVRHPGLAIPEFSRRAPEIRPEGASQESDSIDDCLIPVEKGYTRWKDLPESGLIGRPGLGKIFMVSEDEKDGTPRFGQCVQKGHETRDPLVHIPGHHKNIPDNMLRAKREWPGDSVSPLMDMQIGDKLDFHPTSTIAPGSQSTLTSIPSYPKGLHTTRVFPIR